MSLKIVFLDEYTVNGADVSSIRSLGDYTGYEATAPEQVLERCKGANVVITNKVVVDAEKIASLPDLKLICVAATGMNNVDLAAAEKHGVQVKNAVGYSTDSVAELTFMGVLGLLRQVSYYDEFVKSGAYATSPRLFDFGRPTHELKGKRWGIIGLGNIGRRVAEIAKVFGCEVSYYSTSGKNTASTDYQHKPLEQLMAESDIVSVHSPLNAQTSNLIDYPQLKLMKRNALIVNVARGGIINESGLVRALNENLIAGPFVDVFSVEPIAANNPLLSVNDKHKLIMTPHIAWSTQEAIDVVVKCVRDNIANFIAESK